MGRRSITVGQCWTKLNYNVINVYGVDAYLIGELGLKDIIKTFMDVTEMNFDDIINDFYENFEDRYKNILLYSKNYPAITHFDMEEHKLVEDSKGAYCYMVLYIIMIYLRENVDKVRKICPNFYKTKIVFDDSISSLTIYDMLLHGDNSLASRLNIMNKRDCIFSKDYDITEIDYTYLELDKYCCITMLSIMLFDNLYSLTEDLIDSMESDINDLKARIKRKDEKYALLKEEYHSYKFEKSRKNDSVEAEVKALKDDTIRKSKEIDDLTDEIFTLERRIALLEDKNKIYEMECQTEEEKEVLEEVFKEKVEDIDVSDYKIIIITTEGNSAFPFSVLDLTNQTERIIKLRGYDIVAFDTRHNSHSCYNNVKKYCKSNGIKFMHLDCSPNNTENEIKKYILIHSLN